MSDLPTNAAYLKHLLVTAFCGTGQKFSGLELGLRLWSRLCRLLGLRSTKNIHVQRFQHILDKITMRDLTRIIAVSSMLLTRFPLFYLNFHPLDVASRYRDPQLQVGLNDSYWFNLEPKICISLMTQFVPKINDLIG